MYIQSYGRPDECQFGRKNNKTQSHQTAKTVFLPDYRLFIPVPHYCRHYVSSFIMMQHAIISNKTSEQSVCDSSTEYR